MASLKALSKKIADGVNKAYAPIKAISPGAIAGGLAAGHIVGGYSGSAAAQANLYHLGRKDALSKKASIINRVAAARGFVTAAGNTAKGIAANGVNSLKRTSIGQSAVASARKVAQSPLGTRVSQGVKTFRTSPSTRTAMKWVGSNPGKAVAGAATAGFVGGSMTKSSGLYQRSLSALQVAAKKHPIKAKIIGGAAAFGAGLGATHVADEHVDTAIGQAAVYPFRKKHGYTNQ